jgi:homocysteine S-methyltransferase
MPPLIDRLATEQRPLLLDGATGTELNRRGVDTSLPLWSAAALLRAPDVLRQIHADYVAAGAELITANTFRTHARNLMQAGIAHRAAELTRQAVEIARDAADGRAWVVGSQAPLEDCYSPKLVPGDKELAVEHAQMSQHLADAGVDTILVETHNAIREAVAATLAASATGLPVLVSFVCGVDGRLLSGETIAAAVNAVRPFRPTALLVNCIPSDAAEAMLRELQGEVDDVPCGVYANVGRPDPEQGWVNTDAVDPQRYARYAEGWLSTGARLIGGCCGTTPEHIRRLANISR